MVVVVNRCEKCVVFYGKGVDVCVFWMVIRIIVGFFSFYDVCFVLNNSFVVLDIGDNKIKIYKLEGGL